MREILALTRVAWLNASSYKLGLVISIAGFILSFVPVFFVANALQPMVQESIQLESQQYFSFLVIGLGLFSIITAAASTLPGAISGSISSGTLEALLATPAPVHKLVLGLGVYPLLWSALRAGVLLFAAALLGTQIWWSGLPLAALIVLLVVATYFTFALIASALVLAFRTAGPVVLGVLTASALLGGVYYSTSAIPSWIQILSRFVPLTYGLRALRRVLLNGASITDVSGDVFVLIVTATTFLAVGSWSFALALRHSRRAGTLAQY